MRTLLASSGTLLATTVLLCIGVAIRSTPVMVSAVLLAGAGAIASIISHYRE